jgi:hemolysin activation/secretion protein
MSKSRLITVALLASSQGAYAQQLPAGAGGQIQQIPPAPKAAQGDPDFRVKPRAVQADAGTAGARIQVRSLRVTGASLFSEDTLIAATAFRPGSELNLAELRTLAAKISAYYNERGYFLALAYLPAQNIDGGSVTIAVIEGRYGKVSADNKTNLSNGAAQAMVRGLNSGDIVASAPLERRLLLMSDIPGVQVKSVLTPGTAVGTSDLVAVLSQGRRITGSTEADNAGNRYTGAYRLGGGININNPAGIGDLVSLRLLASTSSLGYGRLAYQAPVGGATVGAAYTYIRYRLGRDFRALRATGNADIMSLFASYPLIRSRSTNLYATAGVDSKRFEDRIGLDDSESRRRSRVLNFGVSGNSEDGFGGGGWNVASLGWTTGRLNIRSPLESATDALTARSEGGFSKAQFSAARLQSIAGPVSLYASLRGQLAFDNLDSSEKMELGGAYGVRAYPEGEAYGDQGYLATVEGRVTLARSAFGLPGELQSFGFVDVGQVDYAKDPWFSESNRAHRSGIGAGLSWAAPGGLLVKGTYAHKLGNAETTSGPDKSGRAWFQIVKLF